MEKPQQVDPLAEYNGKFKIREEDVIQIAKKGQERDFAEEIDYLEERGNYEWLERELHTNFKTGLQCFDRVPNPNETPEEQAKNAQLPGEIADYDERKLIFSCNQKVPRPPKSFCRLLFEALNDFTLKILICAAIVSIIIELSTAEDHELAYSWVEGFAILVAVMVCSMVTAVNDYQKEKQFQVLNAVADERKTVTVIRGGKEAIIHQDLLMTGDIVKCVEGMEVPADGCLFKSSELTTDESAMTGETDPVKKNVMDVCIAERNKIIADGQKNMARKHDVPSPLIMSGTRILTGEGMMVVVVVGKKSCLGKIKELLEEKDEETPLQAKLTKIAEDIGNFGLYSSIAIVFVMLIRFTVERIVDDEGFDSKEHIGEILDFFIIGITVVVVAIPEGLPLAVTLSLAFSVKKMLKDQNLVRKLQACETMGGANTICSDKTGTLTKNEMTLVQLWNIETIEFPDVKEYDLDSYFPDQGYQNLFVKSSSINSGASLHPEERGSKTDTALLKFLMKTKYDYREQRKQFEAIRTYPFSSARKRMSTIIEENGQKRMYVKGASEMVLASCDKWVNKKTGSTSQIDGAQKKVIEDGILGMAQNALRTICIAYKDLSGSEDLDSKDNLGVFNVETKGLTLVAILGIADIIRPEVPGAVDQCIKAGIKVRMVTGDNKDTARAIAQKCGIMDPNSKDDLVIEGPEFIRLTGGVVCKKCKTFHCDCPRDAETAAKQKKKQRVDTIKNPAEFDKIYQNLCVMARSRPEDKYALATGLIERSNVVAVTGDGTNDAPALKKADVGFAMGIAGTEVAREASDIILLDDNFNSIVKAVMWGRNIYDSIKKFLQFQLTVNVVAVSCTLIGAAVIKQEVLTPIQMLWVNLIMDTFASLALATEPPTEELLRRKPHNRKEYIISKKMTKHIFGQSLFQTIVILLFVFGGEKFLPEWESSRFVGEVPKKLKEYTDNLSTNGLLYDEALRYYQRQPYKIQFQTEKLEYVVSGRLKSYSGFEKEYYNIKEIFGTPSRHFTYIFNVFVLMQVFNFLNARKLKDEINIFEGLSRNMLFPVIVGIIIAFQILIVTVGGKAFYCFSYEGLNIQQWLICVGFSIIGNFVSILIKFIPEEKFLTCKVYEGLDEEEKDEDDEEEENTNNNNEKAPLKEQEAGSSKNKVAAVEPISSNNNNNNNDQNNYDNQPKQHAKPQETDEQPDSQYNNTQNNNGDIAKQAPDDENMNGQNDEQLAHQENQE